MKHPLAFLFSMQFNSNNALTGRVIFICELQKRIKYISSVKRKSNYYWKRTCEIICFSRRFQAFFINLTILDQLKFSVTTYNHDYGIFNSWVHGEPKRIPDCSWNLNFPFIITPRPSITATGFSVYHFNKRFHFIYSPKSFQIHRVLFRTFGLKIHFFICFERREKWSYFAS